MGIEKNKAGQKVAVFAYNTYYGTGVPNDENNITAYISKDFGTPTGLNDLHPVPLSTLYCPGTYVFDLTQVESSGSVLYITPSSSGVDVSIDPIQIFTYPANFSGLSINENGTQNVNIDTIKEQTVSCTGAVNIYSAVGNDYKLAVENDGDAHADVKQWLGTGPASLTDTDKLQCSVQHIAISYDYTAVHVWYVSKTGNDANAGHSWASAKLTVSAAVAAATAGDTIMVGPGVFEEAVDASVKDGLWFEGAGVGTQITYGVDDSSTMALGNYSTIKSIRITSTSATADSSAVNCENKTKCRLIDSIIEGTYDGILATGSSYLRIESCCVSGTYDGIILVNGNDWFIENSIISTNCEWNSGNGFYRALLAWNGRGKAERCIFRATRNDTTSSETAAVVFDTGNYELCNCFFYAEQLNAGGSGEVAGVIGGDGYGISVNGTTGNVSIIGGAIFTKQLGSGSNIHHLWQSSGTLAVSGLTYDESKTSGTITKMVVSETVLSTVEAKIDNIDVIVSGIDETTTKLDSMIEEV